MKVGASLFFVGPSVADACRCDYGLVEPCCVDEAWDAFKLRFPKSYNSDDEETQRKQVFAENYARIVEHNNAGVEKYTLGVNQFSDLTEAEWSAAYKGAAPPEAVKDDLPYLGQVEETLELADSMDWVSRGAVTPVKNQGGCGSCWSFSTTGAMEGAYQVATGQLLSLAEQQLVDCDTADGGCSGGWPYRAMTYASENGACLESSYPYHATDGSCAQSSCTLGLTPGTVTGYMSVGKTTSALMSALNSQPVSITVNAAGSAFQSYSGGVMTQGCTGSIDHAVLAVGYGTHSDGTPYYRIKNSWGTTWGDAGFFNLERGVGSDGALCVLQYHPSVPTIAAPAPSPSGSCSVGDSVTCPSGEACAGNQCCKDGSTCPSAAATFSNCPQPKTFDCTQQVVLV